jgi:hypothetical protein
MVDDIKLLDITKFDYKPYVKGIDTFLRIAGMYDNLEESLQNQSKQFDEEIEELYQAIMSKNTAEVLDGIGDCLFVQASIILLGVHLQRKITPSKAFFTLQGLTYLAGSSQEVASYCLDAVVESNLSKFDKSIDEASATVAHYASLNVTTEAVFDTESNLWFVKVTEDCTDTNGKTYHKGKILKSTTNYHAPDFSLALKGPKNDNCA